jgi:hypothetical protein
MSISVVSTQACHVRNVTEYGDGGTEKVQIEKSEDNGAHWTVIRQATGRKIGE